MSKYLFPDRPGDGDIDWAAFVGASALSHETFVQPGGGKHTRRCRPPPSAQRQDHLFLQPGALARRTAALRVLGRLITTQAVAALLQA